MRKLHPASWQAALLFAALAPASAPAALPTAFFNDVLATGLDRPTSLAFLPDGRVLFTEQRTGRVRLFVGGHIAASDPVLAVPSLAATSGEQGLQSLALDPDWPARPYVYLCYTRTGGVLRLVRYTAVGEVAAADGENLTLLDPLLLMDDIPDQSPVHQGGCLRFGVDDHLYFSLGEDNVPCDAADSSSLRGQILRLDVSDLPPGGGPQVPREWITPLVNPLTTTDPNARLVWAFGLRNPWRFDVDPLDGRLYVADVGSADYEEINQVEPGDFLGWPWREGFMIKIPSGCPEPGGMGTMPFKAPIVSMGRGFQSTAIVGATVYRPLFQVGDPWPLEYTGNVFYGEYYSGFIRRVQHTGDAWETPPPVTGQPDANDWATGLSSLVELRFGPDGSLWYMRQFDDGYNFSSGSFGRIRYQPGSLDAGRPAGGPLGLRAAPNPFAGLVHVSFRLDAPEAVRVDVLDVAGRRVGRLLDGLAPAGETRLQWNGAGADGRQVPPGLYLVRIERSGAVETLRVLRAR